jgi:hypothetical protein
LPFVPINDDFLFDKTLITYFNLVLDHTSAGVHCNKMTSRPILFRLLNNNILFVIIGASWLISQVSAEVTYILSDTNVLTCPAGSVPVDSPEECEVAATAVSIAWGGSWPDIINPNLSSAACVNDLNYNDFSWFRAETDYNYRPGYKLVCKIGEFSMTS